MLAKPDTRWGACATHLAICAPVFIVLACVIVFIWYPGFLFRTDGGWQGVRLIAGIDLVLGPLLTLIVYNKTKSSLNFDLSVIAAVQLTALCVGCYLVYHERPIAVVFADNKFSTMSHNSFAFNGLDPADIPILSEGKKPVWIYAQSGPRMPGESEADAFNRRGPPHLRINDYLPFKEHAVKLEGKGQLQVEGNQAYSVEARMRYFRMLSRYFEGYLVFDFTSERVVKSILTNSTDVYTID